MYYHTSYVAQCIRHKYRDHKVGCSHLTKDFFFCLLMFLFGVCSSPILPSFYYLLFLSLEFYNFIYMFIYNSNPLSGLSIFNIYQFHKTPCNLTKTLSLVKIELVGVWGLNILQIKTSTN